ncbi:hypothetical protein BVC80_715g9 [Macleaya cordata]|uniref:Uncharacterized protein n=1 Tax=Macleaya cordata TaxID=56857 RepID=A0A200PM78_MACCD|nr:hypothetical protein BVC80_715g9 [Macleaya cordata]
MMVVYGHGGSSHMMVDVATGDNGGGGGSGGSSIDGLICSGCTMVMRGRGGVGYGEGGGAGYGEGGGAMVVVERWLWWSSGGVGINGAAEDGCGGQVVIMVPGEW